MSGYKNFAVIGAGNIGSFIIDSLLEHHASGKISSVTVITRSDTKAVHPEWVTKGAKFLTIDPENHPSFTEAFSGVDVLISTAGSRGAPWEKHFVPAAKAAGVQLFLPSEFGIGSLDNIMGSVAAGVAAEKKELMDKLREYDLPYSLVHTGMWPKFILVPHFGWDLEKGTVEVVGKGDTPITWTSRDDSARFLTHILLELPKSKLEGSEFYLEAERLTLNQIIAQYEERAGKKLVVTYVPVSTAQQHLQENPSHFDIIAGLKIAWENGVAAASNPTDAWPEWRPKSVLDAITSEAAS